MVGASEGRTGYRWTRLGGHVGLDLCNTVSWRRDPTRTTERLRNPGDLVDWYGVVGDPSRDARSHLGSDVGAHPRRATDALRAVRRLRDATGRLLDAHLDRSPATAADVVIVTRARAQALAVADTAPTLPLATTVEPTTSTRLAHALALSVVDLLQSNAVARIRRCEGPGCGWFFLDTTRNHSRRWCDSLDCGNRVRVRNYVRRHRPALGSPE